MKTFLSDYWELIAGILVGITGWFKEILFFKSKIKQDKANVEGDTIQNLNNSVSLYQKLIDDIIPRYEKEQTELREEIKYYRNELDKYREGIQKREQEILLLHKELNELRAEVFKLKKFYGKS